MTQSLGPTPLEWGKGEAATEPRLAGRAAWEPRTEVLDGWVLHVATWRL